ncbi:MAG: hypothetical protein ACFFGP_13090, partial [Promethearchaeota archaeon]
MKSSVPGIIAIIAGILAILATPDFTGFGLYVFIFQAVAVLLFIIFNGPPPFIIVILVFIVFLILFILAVAGGFTVILGGILILGFEKLMLGRFLIGIGIRAGLISLIFFLIVATVVGVLIIAIFLML